MAKYLVSLDFADMLAGNIRLSEEHENMVWDFCRKVGVSDFDVKKFDVCPISVCAIVGEMAYCAEIRPLINEAAH